MIFSEPRWPCQFGQLGEGGGGSAKRSSHIKEMARPGCGAEQGSSMWNSADEDDIGDGDGRLGEVAAGERDFVGCGEGEQAVEEGLNPCGTAATWDGELPGHSEREKSGDGTSAHGGQVAQSPG